MSNVSNVTVQDTGVKQVTVKGKPKNTYSFKADGQWYRTNFKDHELGVGDVVSFGFTEDKWGKNVEADDITRTGKAAPAAANAPQAGGNSRETAIIRQNALSHATALITKAYTIEQLAGDIDLTLANVVRAARFYESYVTGELDEIEAMAAQQEAKAA